MTDESFKLTPELLDDFYAECDEQLSGIRRQLAVLRAGADADSISAALDGAYRNLHSFKGNCAIVGLKSAESLAHAAEDLLRRLTRNEAELDPRTLDVLEEVAGRLESSVAAFRSEQPVPDVNDLMPRLREPSPAVPIEERTGTTAKPSARRVVRVRFQPSTDLDARGINVGSVRARLSELGEIASAEPVIAPGGKVSFEFGLSLAASAQPLPDWTTDGLHWLEDRESQEEISPDGSGVSEPDAAPVPTTRPAAESSESASAPAAGLVGAASHVVRVDLARLDELMRIAGEMVILRSRLQERIARLSGPHEGLQEVSLSLGRSLRELREGIMRVRLVPVLEIFSRLPYVVRDLTRDTEKSVRLVLEGQETEIDKFLVERLREPLLHLVRNAISHGVETVAERDAAGKPSEATLRLRAAAAGDSVRIQIWDDGRGVDRAQVLQRATAAGIAVPAELDETGLLHLLCTPGFSTRDEADRAAGRGVGMAVVESTLRELGGSVSLRTERGRFTEFTLHLPLTLSITETFVAAAGDQLCALPQGKVEEVIQLRAADIRTFNEAEAGPHRGTLLPLLRLRRMFGLAPVDAELLPVLVLNTERGLTGLIVDRIVGQREVVVRPMRDPLVRVPGVTGATELGDGRPVLILDPASLTHAVTRLGPAEHDRKSVAVAFAS